MEMDGVLAASLDSGEMIADFSTCKDTYLINHVGYPVGGMGDCYGL